MQRAQERQERERERRMCRQQRGVRTESAVRYGCGPTRGEKESAERAAVSICWDGTEVPRGAFLQALRCHVTAGVALPADVAAYKADFFLAHSVLGYHTINHNFVQIFQSRGARLSLLPPVGRCRSRPLRRRPRGSCLLVSARPQRVSRPDPRRHREWPTRLPGEPARKR